MCVCVCVIYTENDIVPCGSITNNVVGALADSGGVSLLYGLKKAVDQTLPPRVYPEVNKR